MTSDDVQMITYIAIFTMLAGLAAYVIFSWIGELNYTLLECEKPVVASDTVLSPSTPVYDLSPPCYWVWTSEDERTANHF